MCVSSAERSLLFFYALNPLHDMFISRQRSRTPIDPLIIRIQAMQAQPINPFFTSHPHPYFES